MDPERKRIEEDLRGLVSGEVLCDDANRALYATDASLFEVWPLVIVRPRTAEDVAATVKWAAEQRIPVHARGAGSSLSGDSLGRGIVIDCSRFMRRIITTAATTVRAQPGVVAAQLEEHLARLGRSFGPDPASAGVTTLGGMIGRNTSGSRFLRAGAIRGRLVAAQVVLADGTLVELVPTAPGRPDQGADAMPATGSTARLAQLADGVATILEASRGVIARSQPAERLAHGGYRLDDLEGGGLIHLPRLFCGSAGTLGIVTEATLETVPAEGATAVALLLFESLEKAAEAALRLAPLGPSACDLFDKRHLALARSAKVHFDLLIPPVADAGLLVEFSSDDPAACSSQLDEALRRISAVKRLCIDVRRAEDPIDAALFWELSRQVVSTLHGVRGTSRPVPFVEDVVVPPARLPEFLKRLQGVLKQHAATAMLFGHAGHGQLHVRPHAQPRDVGERQRLERLADALYEEVVAVGGTIGGEQGLGLSRTVFFEKFFPELAGVFADVKRVFDPLGILNPGKITRGGVEPAAFRPALEPRGVETGLLPTAVSAAAVLPVLNWTGTTLAQEVDACNGCGACRSQSAAMRMCPRYRENAAEESSPRAKANLMAALLSGGLDAKSLSADAVREIADTCFNCHQCRIDCAAGVDIPALVTELKAAHVAANSLGTAAWMRSRVDGLSALGGRFAPLANRALASPRARWLLEKMLGIAQGRKLPTFSGNKTMRWATRRGLTRPSRRGGPRVLYFLDTFARRHDPLLAQAFVSVLERNGIGVFIDPRQAASGMPLVSEGDVAAARKVARTNMRVLAEAVRLGYRIVSTEPAAVTCITHDYPLLLDDDDMGRVVEATTDATSYLWELHREGRLRLDFKPLPARVLYHAPCHVRARGGTSPAENLLRLIPGLAVQAADRGCSGMAGTFGLSRENYRASLRAGLGLVTAMRSAGVEAGATECSACRIQMEQGTTKPTVHPVKLLAKAYGSVDGSTVDELDGLLTATSGRLTTS
ncbi:MAG: FAD-binding protein [Planctomycetia bacterium]|jgi:FAD/FMN-containing dehydrogenase/Fe-S oxidoreductase|nr:FAD-binding protein [Planctomycetia bacterium]